MELDFNNSKIIQKLDEFKITNSNYSGEKNKSTIIDNLDKYNKFFNKNSPLPLGEGLGVRAISGDKSGVRAFLI
ncbi:TPA: hypothetical protein DEG21_04335 [Patescibacteria group bacterium]|nr:hypothetical protein [Candidatus Gracilibacteria bacterium]HBY75065.1 hypothetical protein [Candidatus Gracilibacteria bacterium]